jgi:hypothetical protein
MKWFWADSPPPTNFFNIVRKDTIHLIPVVIRLKHMGKKMFIPFINIIGANKL